MWPQISLANEDTQNAHAGAAWDLPNGWEWAMSPKWVCRELARNELVAMYRIQSLYMEWGGYWSLHCHMQPPSSKQCPHRAASLQGYENVKWEKSCLENGKESDINGERNELITRCKGRLRIPKTGTNCLRQHWTGPAGYKGGSDLTIT